MFTYYSQLLLLFTLPTTIFPADRDRPTEHTEAIAGFGK